MTSRQTQLLTFLRQRELAGGAMPSMAEMAAHLGVKQRSNVFRLLNALEEAGAITRQRHRNRAIKVVGLSEFERGRIAGYRDGYADGLAERRAA